MDTILMPSNKLLLFLKVPPPLTGATLLNKHVSDSKLINESFIVSLIPISYKNSIEDKSFFSLKKLTVILSVFQILCKRLLINKPQLVYFQISPLGWAFLRDCIYVSIIKLLRKKLVFHLHGKGIKEKAQSSKFYKKLYKWAFKNSSIICLSSLLVDDVKEVYSGKPYIVPNGIELTSIIKNEDSNSSVLNILFLSNLIITKGIFIYLDALALLKERGVFFNGIIIGKEVELTKEQLYSHIQKRNLEDRVTYLGPKFSNEKFSVLANSDILIYPTLEDVWGLVILEAMQIGLPVVASNEGAISEVVEDEVTGFVVNKGDTEGFANRIEFLIDNPKIRIKMGHEGKKKFYSNYTIESFEKNLTSVFEDIFLKLD